MLHWPVCTDKFRALALKSVDLLLYQPRELNARMHLFTIFSFCPDCENCVDCVDKKMSKMCRWLRFKQNLLPALLCEYVSGKWSPDLGPSPQD